MDLKTFSKISLKNNPSTGLKLDNVHKEILNPFVPTKLPSLIAKLLNQ